MSHTPERALDPMLAMPGEQPSAPRRRADYQPPEWLRIWVPLLVSCVTLAGATGACFAAQGYRGTTPADRVAVVEREQVAQAAQIKLLSERLDAMPRQIMDSVRAVVTPVELMQVAHTKYRCLRISPREAYLLNMPCDSILRPYGLRTGQNLTGGASNAADP